MSDPTSGPEKLPVSAAYFTLHELTQRWSCRENAVRGRMQRYDTEVRKRQHPTDRRVAMYFADDVRALERRLGLSVHTNQER